MNQLSNASNAVLVADDHTLIREGIASLLERIDGISEVVQTGNGRSALDLILKRTFELVVLDIGLPGLTGLDIAREIRRREMPTRVVIMTGLSAENLALEALNRVHVDAFFFKTAELKQVNEAVTAALNGDQYFPTDLEFSDETDGLSSGAADVADLLSNCEMQVIKLVAEGHTSNSAGELLGISTHTVRKHRENIKRKLGLGTVAELSAFAVRNNMI